MNKSNNFPKGWDERMVPEIFDPVLWDETQFTKHARMGVDRSNNGFVKILQEETRTMLPKIIATLRWSEFGWTKEEMAHAAGLSTNGYKPMEQDIGKRQPQYHTYRQELDCLESLGVSLGIREQILDLLTMPDLFEQKNPCDESESYETPITLLQLVENVRNGTMKVLNHSHVSAFLHRIGYDKGHSEVESHFKHIWNIVHSRGYVGTIPKAPELLDIIDTMYAGSSKIEKQMHALRREEGEGVWIEAKKSQYRERTIEEPLVELLSTMEMDLAKHWQWHDPEDKKMPMKPMTFTSEALRACYGLEELASRRLVQFELISWEEIADIAEAIIEPKRFKQFERDWKAAYTEECDRYGFPNSAVSAMEERGYSFKDVADILGVKIDESRRKKSEEEREQRDRPEAQIRNIMLYNRQSSQVAIEGLLRVIARDEDHYNELRMLYEDERERYYRRQGERLHGKGMKMRILSELANVSTRVLARDFIAKKYRDDAVKVREFETDVIQKVERQEITHPRVTFERIYKYLTEKIALEKAKTNEALDTFDDFPDGLREFIAVHHMAENCIKGMRGGGANMVAERMRDEARTDSDWLRPDVVQDVAFNKFVPPLPSVRLMAKAVTDQVLERDCPKVLRNWYEEFPYQLAKGCPTFVAQSHTFTQPMTRVLLTQIAAVDSNLIHFFQKRTSGIVATHGTELIRYIEEEGCDERDWQRVRKIMIDAGNSAKSAAFLVGELLFHNGQKVREALLVLQPELQRRHIEPHPVNLKGLTSKETAVLR